MPRQRRQTANSNTYRFFVNPGAIQGDRAQITDPELAHQIAGVLRLSPGDRVVLLDGAGGAYVVALEHVERRGPVSGVVERVEPPGANEPRAQITLYLPLIRPERFEWALQKGVELGVAAFVPTLCEHSLSDSGPAEKKLERWRTIVREAAEQSRRTRLPPIEPPVFFAGACARATGTHALLLWEGQGAEALRAALRRQTRDQRPTTRGQDEQEDARSGASAPSSLAPRPWSILSGPEGGLSERERRTAADHGIIEVSLGPRTMRAETAPIVAAAAILYELGELE